LGVFGADELHPFVQGAPKRHRRRPGHRESPFILDRDLDLEPLALVVRIGSRSIVRIVDLEMLLFGPFERFLRALIIKQPVPFHQVQGIGIDDFLEESEAYPNSRHLDQIDAAAMAFHHLTASKDYDIEVLRRANA
jgi:hypothetical protein